MAIDVLLSTDEITVLGPPNNIELSVNIGPAGDRGSQIFFGLGNPNDSGVVSSDVTPQVYDIFINASTSSRYSWVYQYITKPAGLTWEPIMKMSPSIYSENLSVTFSAGIATITVLLTDITGADVITDPERYIVSLTPMGADPVAFAVNSKTVNTGATPTISLVVEAVKYSASTWSALTGVVTWGVTISVV